MSGGSSWPGCVGDRDPTLWRLLLQLSLDRIAAGALQAHGHERLYLWISEAALAAGDLSGIRAFAQ